MGIAFQHDRKNVLGGVRACTVADMPAVAEMFENNFGSSRRKVPAALTSYLAEVFLDHPWREPGITSQVFVSASGRVEGFVGVLPLRMRFRGKPVRAVHAGSLMVEDPKANPLAGARLLRTVLNGPQDLSISESANQLSQAMWTKLRGQPIPGYSMEWIKVLRPTGLVVAEAGKRFAPAKLLKSLSGLGDRLASRAVPGYFQPPEAGNSRAHGVVVDAETLLDVLPKFVENSQLHPDPDPECLAWRLAHAQEKQRHGPMTRRVVYGRGGKPLGCYIYYGRPGGIGWVLQIFSIKGAAETVVDDLMLQAYEGGATAVRGRTEPCHTDVLMRRGCVFLNRSSMVVHSQRADIVEAIQLGNAQITGLAAEAWCKLIGHDFE